MAIIRKIQEKRDEYRVRLINDKWEIMQLAHRMMKSDRPDYRR